jgi:flagellar basal-body rod modification protein FlgD
MLPTEVTGSSVGSTVASSPAPDDLGRQDFLRMLVAQLENQDPLNPQDGTEFTAQLAQFSSLEQLIAMRSSIEALTSAETNARSTTEALAAAGLIGREVLAESDAFEVSDGGSVPPLSIELSGPADSASVRVLDRLGQEVRTVGMAWTPGESRWPPASTGSR